MSRTVDDMANTLAEGLDITTRAARDMIVEKIRWLDEVIGESTDLDAVPEPTAVQVLGMLHGDVADEEGSWDDRLREVAATAERAAEAAAAAKADRDRVIREAAGAGVSKAAIVRATGLSRSQVWNVLQ